MSNTDWLRGGTYISHRNKAKIGTIYKPIRKLNTRQKKQVKRLIGNRQETKYFTKSYTNVTIDFNGLLHDLSNVSQGDGDSERDGDKIYLKMVHIRGYCQVSSASTYNVIRFLLVQWKPNSIPSVSDILQNIGTANAPNSFINWDKRQMFRVLKDWRQIVLGTDRQAAMFNVKITSKKILKQLQFVSGGTTCTNMVYLLAISDDGLTSFPAFTYYSRVTYTDS